MPVNKFPLKILAWEPEGTNKERPEAIWEEYDGVGLNMAWQKGTRERYMWRNLVLG
jgi:hypothetical protein